MTTEFTYENKYGDELHVPTGEPNCFTVYAPYYRKGQGIILSVRHSEITKSDGFTSTKTTLFDERNKQYFVKPLKRKSQKQERDLFTKVEANLQAIHGAYLADDTQAIFEYIGG